LPRPIAGQPYDTETHLDCIFRSSKLNTHRVILTQIIQIRS
jgi:hypothetical protein